MTARLSSPAIAAMLPAPVRAARAAGAKRWFASLALPTPLRAPLARVATASAGESAADLAAALGAVIAGSRKHLDDASLAELDSIVRQLTKGAA
jgi:6,7-dimethyl-8-ribityllumazine synthase